MKRNIRQRTHFRDRTLFLFISLLTVLALSPETHPQDVDSFYLRSMNDGIKLFQAGEYSDAVKMFDLAAFGLSSDKTLYTKNLIYLSLCHFKLENHEESGMELNKALDLFNPDQIRAMGFPPSDLQEINTLLAFFDQGEEPPPPPVKKTTPRQVKQPIDQQIIRSPVRASLPRSERATQLEREIQSKPQVASLYYDLYNIYIQNGDRIKARQLLTRLVRNKPQENRAHYLLGGLYFSERDYKKSEKSLEQFLNLSARVSASEEDMNNSRGLLILCAAYMDKREKEQTLTAGWIDLLNGKLDDLTMGEQDRNRLRAIFRSFYSKNPVKGKRQIETDSIKRNLSLKAENYYELYRGYLAEGRIDAARGTLEELIQNDPAQINAYLYLAKLEYSLREYGRMIQYHQQVRKNVSLGNIPALISNEFLIYSILSFYHLKTLDEAQSQARILFRRASDTEISEIIKSENLKYEWQEAMRAIGRDSEF
ncbi:tetratricopeptide repeat protein [Acidobacteriota bacterium]